MTGYAVAFFRRSTKVLTLIVKTGIRTGVSMSKTIGPKVVAASRIAWSMMTFSSWGPLISGCPFDKQGPTSPPLRA